MSVARLPLASHLTSKYRQFRRWAHFWFGPVEAPASEQAAFEAEADSWNLRYSRALALLALVFIEPLAVYVEMRLHGGGAIGRRNLTWHLALELVDLLCAFPPSWLRRRPLRLVFLLLSAHGLMVGATWAIGLRAGGPSELHTLGGLFLFMDVPVIMLLGTRVRIRATAVMLLAILAGFAIEFPARLGGAMLGVVAAMLIGGICVAFIGGCFVTNVRKRALFERLRLGAKLEATTREMRALASDIEGGREADHARIAREIHDELGQALTTIRLLNSLPPDANTTHEIDAMLDSVFDSVRRIIGELRPPMLDDLGLSATARWLVSRHGKLTGARCECVIDLGAEDESDLDGPLVTLIFRCLQEALTNVARHARASRVAVELVRENGAIVLRVDDDGVGFAGEAATPPGHFGLSGMRQRARIAGAELQVRGAPGGGTSVVLRAPTGAAA